VPRLGSSSSSAAAAASASASAGGDYLSTAQRIKKFKLDSKAATTAAPVTSTTAAAVLGTAAHPGMTCEAQPAAAWPGQTGSTGSTEDSPHRHSEGEMGVASVHGSLTGSDSPPFSPAQGPDSTASGVEAGTAAAASGKQGKPTELSLPMSPRTSPSSQTTCRSRQRPVWRCVFGVSPCSRKCLGRGMSRARGLSD
jgi:hypothetical protein